MGHNIAAIILKGPYDESRSSDFDLIGIDLGHDLTMFHINHCYSASWQEKLGTTGELDINGVDYTLYPREMAIPELIRKVAKSREAVYAIIATDYFGGIGSQYANVYRNQALAEPGIKTINQALAYMGVVCEKGMDEFDTVGLSHHRSEPDYLEKYHDLADELGV